MRCSQPLANGQWLQVKTTSVPALPVTSAIDSSLPSTFFIFVFATRGHLGAERQARRCLGRPSAAAPRAPARD